MNTNTFLPRPEYPRPDHQRSFIHGVEWLNLNGAWEFRFDQHRRGVEEQWFLPNDERWPEQIIVPFCWESLAAWGESDAAGNDHYYSKRVFLNPLEISHDNYRYAARQEVGWYRRTITLPQNERWEGKRVILHVGAADFFTDAWCNGRPVGRHEGGYTPFEFDLTDHLEQDATGHFIARLVLRVEDPMDNREQPVGKQWGWYTPVSGIWQTVFLEPRAPAYIERFEIVTEIDSGEASLKIFTCGADGQALTAEVTTPDGQVLQETVPVQQDGETPVVFHFHPVMLWDTITPNLYRLKLSLADENGVGTSQGDVLHSYFGMRSLLACAIDTPHDPQALCLNSRPIYLRGALYQSYHPAGIYTASHAETLKNDIVFAKRAGFDLLRIHIKIDDPLLLYWADMEGMLLMADFPNFGEGGDTPLGRARYESMMRAAMRRDFNHPSIIAWCLFNETWGFGGMADFIKLINVNPNLTEEDKRQAGEKLANLTSHEWVLEMFKLAKTLDPTRLVEDMSVVAWEHLEYFAHTDTDINSWHFYSDDYEKSRAHIAEIVEKTYKGSPHNYVEGFAQGDQPLINSEYGGVGALDGDRDISWSFKFLTNELRLHSKLSAYVYTELHDVEWERNGLLNYDRTRKEMGYDPALINNGDVLPIDAPPISRRAPGEKVSVDVYSSHFSRQEHKNVLLQWQLCGVDSLGWLHNELGGGAVSIPFPQYRVELAQRLELVMPEETMLCTLWMRAATPDGQSVARNFIQFFSDGGFPSEQLRPKGNLVLRTRPSDWSAAWWSDGHISREEAEQTGTCFGRGHGWFEWSIPVPMDRVERCRHLQILVEAAAHRPGIDQTDSVTYPSGFAIELNGVRVHRSRIPDHPHDARGALSYLHGLPGGYGYLLHTTLEGDLLAAALSRAAHGHLIVRCLVPQEAEAHNGLTIFGGETGRYPVPPTVIFD